MTTTRTGICYALGACLAWGLVFAIPQLLTQLTPFEVSLSRYFFFGSASAINLFTRKRYLFKAFSFSIWSQAFMLAGVSTFIHYTALIFGLRDTSPAVATLILSLSPVVITFYASWSSHKGMYKLPKIPLIAIATGLILVNLPLLSFETTSSYMTMRYIFGFGCTIIALLTWTWYIVVNSKILSENSQIVAEDWVTVVGFSTFLLALFSIALLIFIPEKSPFSLNIFSSTFLQIILGGLALGIVSSWYGTYLWNQAAKHLPVTFAGQITLFETIFGLLFVFIINQRLPVFMEVFGISLMLCGVFLSYRQIINTCLTIS